MFLRITLGMLAVLLFGGVAGGLYLAHEAESINRSGGWGWILFAGIYVAAITVVCAACVVCTAISLFRREPRRRLAMVILGISSLVVLSFGGGLIRTATSLRGQHDEAASEPTRSPGPPADTQPSQPVADGGANAPPDDGTKETRELQSQLWNAIRANDADAFVDCFFIEEPFNTPVIREENRNQVEILLRNNIVDVGVRDIPDRELAEIRRIQSAAAGDLPRYSLVPKKMLSIRHEARDGSAGRTFLIGERHGKWYIVRRAGHPT